VGNKSVFLSVQNVTGVPGAVSAGGKVFSAEVKNEWSRTYTPQYAFMARPGAEN